MTGTTVDGAAHLAIAELEDDIVNYLHEDELRKMPSARVIASQPDIGWEMRARLIEFLMQAQHILGLSGETLMLGIAIADRYSAKRVIFARHHQLVGCVSLWLASKILGEKNKVPTVSDLSYICAGTYAESTIRDMELHVLASLDWELNSPTTYDFIDWNICCVYRKLVDMDAVYYSSDDYAICGYMARYICTCAAFNHEVVFSYPPSAIAASSVALSFVIIDALGKHNRPFMRPIDFSKECFDDLASSMSDPPMEAAQRFSSVELLNVASRVQQFFQERIAGLAKGSYGFCSSPYSKFSQDVASSTTSLPTPTLFVPDLGCSCDSLSGSPSTMSYVPLTPDDETNGDGSHAKTLAFSRALYCGDGSSSEATSGMF